ncbi:NADH-dependent [FeFe] hydrogenase, group A6 [Acidaminobacter hydrogenoformans]|uniref:NADH-quinone oxidoreductase subunit G n=1 Tax=Acidaminobacter hydrogenoformans DSM 2784 TaxID=1120920 RepID=A0A1G5S2R2_9FIRM|nr:NADH-dependent [FeFe] hydrogenase, group A6 [Acidaminobacter hydrogenoformans]SCZ80654.1 NADH-quinone oxidoreductase subunit G [Acidaminobacter hydrogenoformans DSM 2784]
MIKLTINDSPIAVPKGTTILEAARSLGIHIPTLCHMNLHMDQFGVVNQASSCRVCMVEVKGRPALVTACSEKVTDGMHVSTHTPRAITARRMSVELLLSNHPKDCLMCPKNLECDLQKLAADLGVRDIKWAGERIDFEKDESSGAIVKDPNKCVMCRRCETMCNEVQTCGILSAVNRGFDTFVGPAFNLDMKDTSCTYCGQCVAVCPTAALTENNDIHKVWREINNPNKHVIVQVAPAIRVAVGELFDMPPGSISTGKLATSLKRLGFDAVYDTDFAADLTILEEASELVHRIQHGGTLPILTSCCPAWVQFFEHQYPDMLDIPSTCKSPQIMFGAIAKTYYAEKKGIDPKDIVVVSVMPCIAKKAEAKRTELSHHELQNVDYVLTTREYGLMLKEACIDFANLPEGDFDHMLGESTGASVIFGTTGGVIEAAARTAYEWLTGETLEQVELTQLRGLDGIRSGKVQIGDLELNIGIAHGLGNARKLLDCIKAGECNFQAIEIMACPGGCIGGGGQPYHHGDMEIIRQRQIAIYQEDRNKTKRKSHENQEVLDLYDKYLGKPYGEKAHELLHTHYVPKEKI